MSYQVKAEKLISKPVGDVFRALGEGRLFMNCGADSRIIEVDFRVGGKYKIQFKNKTLVNFGEFLEIVPDKKIVFNWCQTFGADQKPDTTVTIELFADGPKTRLTLLHTGFKDQGVCDGHQKGWIDGLDDFTGELEKGSLRMVRSFNAPIEKLFATVQNPETFFAYMGDLSRGSVDAKVGGKYEVPNDHNGVKGEFLEITPNKKIVISWLSGCGGPLSDSKVTMNFVQREGGVSAVELIHSGLLSEEDKKAHRSGWEHVTEKMLEVV